MSKFPLNAPVLECGLLNSPEFLNVNWASHSVLYYHVENCRPERFGYIWPAKEVSFYSLKKFSEIKQNRKTRMLV